MKLQVIVPSFNCEEWIGRALESIENQIYKNYSVLVIDDASTHKNQRSIIENYCVKNNWSYTFNEINMRAGFNLFNGIHYMNPNFDDVIFILDGDDFLPHENVFNKIADIYSDKDIWFSYGQYAPYPHNTGQVLAEPYSDEQIANSQNGSIRNIPSLINHPISFRYFLFDQLKEEDMKNDSGEWFRAGYDRVMFVPMMEMAAEHYYFCPEVLYSYNSINPISDSYASLPEVHEAHRAILQRPPRQKLSNDWVEIKRKQSDAR